jgi:predicted Zn-dependent protease
MSQHGLIRFIKGFSLKKSFIFYILISIVWFELLYPLELLAQNQVTIQNKMIPPTPEPPLGGISPIILPDLGDVSSESLSGLDENKLGERIMREIRKDPDYITNGLMYDYINQLGKQLVESARQQRISGSDGTGAFVPKFEFFNVRDSSVNAFALPGGYIGVHTGLFVLADNESQLASVMGHEIGHVTQKHIARGAGMGTSTGVVMLASLLLALVASRSNASAAQGIAIGGQALAIQNQLSYSRDAEREADRIGFQILNASGFDVNAMPAFFEKLQRATSIMESGVPVYVRSHPLTVERIAEMQDRVRLIPNKNKAIKNSIDFYLNQVIAKVEQNPTSDGPKLKEYFVNLLSQKSLVKQMQANYGLSLLALKDKKLEEAEKFLNTSKELSQNISAMEVSPKSTQVFDISLGQIAIAKNNFGLAQSLAMQTMKTYPQSKAAGVLLVQAYYSSGKINEGVVWLEKKTKLQKDDSTWWMYLAQGYEKLNRQSSYHAAIAEKYVCEGALPAAIQQLSIAKDQSSGDFYQLSEIEARKKQLELLYREELIDNGKLPKNN